MIRKAEIKDIKSILKIIKACTAHLIEQGIFQWNEVYPNPNILESDISQEELYVLENQDEIIGCICLTTIKDLEYETVKWMSEDAANLYVHRLAVHPAHQGRGFARKLMRFAEEQALSASMDSIRLDTFSKNMRNQRFYEQRGYTRLGEVYFSDQSSDPFYCYELML